MVKVFKWPYSFAGKKYNDTRIIFLEPCFNVGIEKQNKLSPNMLWHCLIQFLLCAQVTFW